MLNAAALELRRINQLVAMTVTGALVLVALSIAAHIWQDWRDPDSGLGHDHGFLLVQLLFVLMLSGILGGVFVWVLHRARRIVQSVAARERQFSDVARAVPGMIYQWQRTAPGRGHFVWVGPNSSAITGLPPAEFMRRQREFRLHPDDRRRWREALESSVAAGEDWNFEGRYILPGGEERILRMAAGTFTDAGGSQLHNGVMLDITAERRLAVSRANAEGRVALLLDAASDAIVSLDCDLRITHSNKGAEAMFGRAAAAMAGGSLAQLVLAEQRPGLDAAIRGLLAGPDGSCEIGSWREVRGLRADGTSFPLLASVSKTTVLGQPMLCAIMRDMTDIADREQRLTELASERERLLRLSEQASRAKSKFLAVMSHELRTPLNAIIGFSEAMATGALGPAGSPQHREYTTDILKSGRHLLAIINDILDLTRIQERGVSMQVEPIAPALAFEDAWLFVKGRATDKGLAVSLQDDTAGATVLCDERALRQMLINLLGNAVKFTPAGGRITVTLQVPPDTGTMTIEIADTGPGVSPVVLQHLGQPFVQDRDSYQADNPGTGLGLAIVAETAAAMQGRVSFRNRPEGGFCACLALPAATG